MLTNLVPVATDLSKISYLVKNYVIKKDVYNTKIKILKVKYFDNY